jgi:adenosylcobinamide-GDP ribazoletransferase
MAGEAEPPAPHAARPNPLAAFLAALQFLTIVPAPLARLPSARELGLAVGFFPLVGLLVGGLLAGCGFLLPQLFPRPVSAVLALAAWVALTGALHLDGFLDACDGLFGGRDPLQRLEIMRDERAGSFALAGGILLLLTKWAALQSVADLPGALLLAPVAGRWVMSLAIVRYPYGRAAGLGQAMKAGATWRQALLASLFAVPVALSSGGWAGLAGLAAAGLAGWAVARFTLARLPGLTGDLYGAVCELGEAAALLALAAVRV